MKKYNIEVFTYVKTLFAFYEQNFSVGFAAQFFDKVWRCFKFCPIFQNVLHPKFCSNNA